jgi:pimeloyl-ACP methyl ester carboxylesterase
MASLRSENSTNVRFGAPAVEADLALDHFLTPPRGERPTIERQLLEQADTWTILAAGSTVRVWSWGAGPIALLVHGWGGRGSQLAPLIQPLLESGRQVVTFDAPAHGDSSGTRATGVTMAQTVLAVAASIGGNIESVIAHSFGAAATTIALSRGLAPKRVAYIAPLFSLERSVRRYMNATQMAPEVRVAFLAAVERDVAPFVEVDGPVLAPRFTTPLLVVHDHDDREVPHTDGAEAAEVWPGAKLVTTRGLGHRRILADEDVVQTVTAYATATKAVRLLLDEAGQIELDLWDREARLRRAFPW